MPVQFSRLDQCHHSGSTLATAQWPSEQPVGTTQCPGSDLVFHPLIVDGPSAISALRKDLLSNGSVDL